MKRIARYFPHFPAIDGPEPPIGTGSRVRTGPPSTTPYLVACALATASIAAAALLTTLPTGPIVELGVIFVALAVVVRWLEDMPLDQGGPWLRRCAELCAARRDAWGLMFYALATVTAFIWLETGSLLQLAITDTPANLLSAAVWWYPMWESVAPAHGVDTFVLMLAAAWAFWLVLGIRPEDEPWLSDRHG